MSKLTVSWLFDERRRTRRFAFVRSRAFMLPIVLLDWMFSWTTEAKRGRKEIIIMVAQSQHRKHKRKSRWGRKFLAGKSQEAMKTYRWCTDGNKGIRFLREKERDDENQWCRKDWQTQRKRGAVLLNFNFFMLTTKRLKNWKMQFRPQERERRSISINSKHQLLPQTSSLQSSSPHPRRLSLRW